ncbi:Prophage integrase [Escherichia coli O104:H4 str. 2009EL-2071]|nr:Prophage integrase [Escherichia coli O104:H4 str. 2009EL-2071]
MALTDAKIRAAKPTDKAYKLTDGAGMFLLVHPNGSRYWRLRYRILGKEKTLALGVYPEVSLSEARTKRDEARKLISEGIDPCEQKRVKKVSLIYSSLLNILHDAGMPVINNGHNHTAIKYSKASRHTFSPLSATGISQHSIPRTCLSLFVLQKQNKFMKSLVVCSKEYLL